MQNHLATLLGGFERSRSREYLLTTKLVHDLSVAAAATGYDLLVYLPTVDADGFDVIFDDRDRLVAMQLKSVVAGGKAANWRIRRSLLRPQAREAEVFGFASTPAGTGRGGGVILTTASAVGDTVHVEYAYTDIVVLSALWSGIVKRPRPQRERLDRLRQALESDADGSVKLPRSAFLPAATPAQVLALAGLHSELEGAWRYQMYELLRHEHLGSPLPAPAARFRRMIGDELNSLGSQPANKALHPTAARAITGRPRVNAER